jgi:hypothetical protein
MDKFTDWHLYIGCPCRINDVGNYTLDGVWNGSLYLRDKGRVSKVFFDEVGCVKLVLRRLESITREENEKYDKWMDFSDYTSGGTFELKKNMVHSSMFVDENNAYIDVYFVAQMINELRKDGFDCDRLIESGQAIDQATLNQNARKQNPKEDHSGCQEEGIPGAEDNQV